jgi:uncharacterized protein (TIGR00661 family)
MNIVYGVSGEGLGHVFEALEIVPRLQREGHRVKVLTFGPRACAALAEFHPLRIEGLPLYFGRSGLSLTKTLVKNRHLPGFYWRHGPRLKQAVAEFGPDLFLTAYEPFTTHLAHALKKPLLSMDNQNELLHVGRPPAAGYFSFRLAQWATRVCTHGAAHYVVKSFRPPASFSSQVHFVSPLIQERIRNLSPRSGGPALVYLTKPNSALLEVLRSVDETFLVYGQSGEGSAGNLRFRSGNADFLCDLSACKAVLGTTGFSLIADAIYLKKPYFGIPLKKQFEQTYNAHFLRDSGIGEFSENPSPAEVAGFIARLPAYRARLQGLNLDPTEQADTVCRLADQIADESGRRPRPVTAACR